MDNVDSHRNVPDKTADCCDTAVALAAVTRDDDTGGDSAADSDSSDCCFDGDDGCGDYAAVCFPSRASSPATADSSLSYHVAEHSSDAPATLSSHIYEC